MTILLLLHDRKFMINDFFQTTDGQKDHQTVTEQKRKINCDKFKQFYLKCSGNTRKETEKKQKKCLQFISKKTWKS
jgi:hypothetical protein